MSAVVTRTNQNATQLKITLLRCDKWEKLNQFQQKHYNHSLHLRIHHRMTCTKLIGHAACTKAWWNLHLETPNENLSKRFVSQSTCFHEFVICDVKKNVSRQWSTSGPVAWCSTGRYQQCQVASMAGTTWPNRGNDTMFPTWLRQKLCETSWNFREKNQRLNDIKVFGLRKNEVNIWHTFEAWIALWIFWSSIHFKLLVETKKKGQHTDTMIPIYRRPL